MEKRQNTLNDQVPSAAVHVLVKFVDGVFRQHGGRQIGAMGVRIRAIVNRIVEGLGHQKAFLGLPRVEGCVFQDAIEQLHRRDFEVLRLAWNGNV